MKNNLENNHKKNLHGNLTNMLRRVLETVLEIFLEISLKNCLQIGNPKLRRLEPSFDRETQEEHWEGMYLWTPPRRPTTHNHTILSACERQATSLPSQGHLRLQLSTVRRTL